MIAGSAVIGENTWIAPSVSVKNKVTIAADTMTGIGAVILKDTYSGLDLHWKSRNNNGRL
jgi:acetyltransferase-like isoleucine patch superfamily enzyme